LLLFVTAARRSCVSEEEWSLKYYLSSFSGQIVEHRLFCGWLQERADEKKKREKVEFYIFLVSHTICKIK